MSFSLTSINIAINSSGVLSADCKDLGGVYRSSTIDLNDYIGNIDGVFTWGSQGFSQTAYGFNVNGSLLAGQLKKLDNSWVNASINLDEHIKNDNGVLKYA